MSLSIEKNQFEYYKALIISSDIYPEAKTKLESLGIEVIPSFQNASVSPFLSKHADMQIVNLDDKNYICTPESYEYYKTILNRFNCNLTCGNTYLSSNYPCDIAYNIVIGEKYAVHNFKYTDSILKESLSSKILVSVSQGYSGCTICALPKDSYITSDEGVAKLLSMYIDLSILKISKANVLLPGFEYGFFGGATFMIGPATLGVNGDISTHPDCKNILGFCEKQGIDVLSLSPKKLMDIGSAVYVA